MKQFFLNIWNSAMRLVSKIHWSPLQALFNGGLYYSLTEADHDKIRELLQKNYFIILTRRKCHLSTFLVGIASLVVSRKWPHYVHVLMNVEGDINGHVGYKLIEATGKGVHYSTFMQVFDSDSVALLTPSGVSPEEWTKILDYVKDQQGKQYDTLFNITTDEKLSCVELVYWGLKQLPDFEQRFPNLIKLLSKPNANLTPQMLYDTGELDLVFEVRR